MELAEVMAVLRAHGAVAEVAEVGCTALQNMRCHYDAGSSHIQRAVEAGALEAVAAAMRAHPQVAALQEQGYWALKNTCTDVALADVLACMQRAAESGALHG